MQKQVETEKHTLKRLPISLRRSEFSGGEIYDGIDFKKDKLKFKNRNTLLRKKARCGQILDAFMDLVIEDIIENNIIFRTLSKKQPVSISVKLITGEKFKIGCKYNNYPGLDFLKTNFAAPEITFTYWINPGETNVPVYLKKIDVRKKLYNNANNGKYN